MTYKHIIRTAHEARQQFEEGFLSPRLLKHLYLSYNFVPDIEEFLKCAAQSFPALNCGLASVYVQHCLQTGTIIKGYYKNNPHTFLKIPSVGLIVDITADQYGGPNVYVGELLMPWLASPQ